MSGRISISALAAVLFADPLSPRINTRLRTGQRHTAIVQSSTALVQHAEKGKFIIALFNRHPGRDSRQAILPVALRVNAICSSKIVPDPEARDGEVIRTISRASLDSVFRSGGFLQS